MSDYVLLTKPFHGKKDSWEMKPASMLNGESFDGHALARHADPRLAVLPVRKDSVSRVHRQNFRALDVSFPCAVHAAGALNKLKKRRQTVTVFRIT